MVAAHHRPGHVGAEARKVRSQVLCNLRVVVVSANTPPTIAAPLGWALSDVSRASLGEALDRNQELCVDPEEENENARLGDLVESLTTRNVCKGEEGQVPVG